MEIAEALSSPTWDPYPHPALESPVSFPWSAQSCLLHLLLLALVHSPTALVDQKGMASPASMAGLILKSVLGEQLAFRSFSFPSLLLIHLQT